MKQKALIACLVASLIASYVVTRVDSSCEQYKFDQGKYNCTPVPSPVPMCPDTPTLRGLL